MRWTWSDQRSLPEGTSTWKLMENSFDTRVEHTPKKNQMENTPSPIEIHQNKVRAGGL